MTKQAVPTIALAVTGSIAAYKAAHIARLLKKRGARVIPIMTRAAHCFIGTSTLSGITGERVYDDMFEPGLAGEPHVAISAEIDVLLIAPATADVLARLAHGRAFDIVTATALCADCPVVIAPAMHPRMWNHPATQRNVATLCQDPRVSFVGPTHGEVASGDVGLGRMVEPEQIVEAVLARIAQGDLEGLRVVVTAGPTVEDLDPVRFISNRSTGKMGFRIAEQAASRGARVTLISGPVALATPPRVERRVDVRSALEMRSALGDVMGADLGHCDALIMTAAVGDFRPKEFRDSKIKRGGSGLTIECIANPDLVAEIGRTRTGAKPVLVAFALETLTDQELIAAARRKLEVKQVDMIVANHAADALGTEANTATIVTPDATETLGVLSKAQLADRILDRVRDLNRKPM